MKKLLVVLLGIGIALGAVASDLEDPHGEPAYVQFPVVSESGVTKNCKIYYRLQDLDHRSAEFLRRITNHLYDESQKGGHFYKPNGDCPDMVEFEHLYNHVANELNYMADIHYNEDGQ